MTEQTNHFKTRLLEDIKLNNLSSFSTDARTEAKELLEFIGLYPFSDEFEVAKCRQAYIEMTDDDFDDVDTILQENESKRISPSAVTKLTRQPPIKNTWFKKRPKT